MIRADGKTSIHMIRADGKMHIPTHTVTHTCTDMRHLNANTNHIGIRMRMFPVYSISECLLRLQNVFEYNKQNGGNYWKFYESAKTAKTLSLYAHTHVNLHTQTHTHRRTHTDAHTQTHTHNIKHNNENLFINHPSQ